MLLDVKNLNIYFDTKKEKLHCIRNLSFNLKKGEVLGVVGESGCGKSITNLGLMGLLPDNAIVEAESMTFEDQELLKLSESEMQKLRGGKIAMIFQNPMSALNPCYTVSEQIEETLKIHTNLDKPERIKRVIELLVSVGIPAPEKRAENYPHELSGGMAQRVMIAMAIACDPVLLIADEPTTALDVTIQKQILDLLKKIQSERDMSLILVTHDLGVVSKYSDRIQVMYAGEKIEDGTAKEIMNDPKHPYTKGLISSLPEVSKVGFRGKLPSIEGIVPSLNNRPRGCQFRERCFNSQSECIENNPINEVVDNRHIKCHFPVES